MLALWCGAKGLGNRLFDAYVVYGFSVQPRPESLPGLGFQAYVVRGVGLIISNAHYANLLGSTFREETNMNYWFPFEMQTIKNRPPYPLLGSSIQQIGAPMSTPLIFQLLFIIQCCRQNTKKKDPAT